MITKFLKFRETTDNGWLNWRFGKCGAVGNAFVLLLLLFDSSYVLGFVDSFVLYSLFVHLRGFCLLIMKIFQKIRQIMLACRFTCVCIAHVL